MWQKCLVMISSLSRVYIFSSAPQPERYTPPWCGPAGVDRPFRFTFFLFFFSLARTCNCQEVEMKAGANRPGRSSDGGLFLPIAPRPSSAPRPTSSVRCMRRPGRRAVTTEACCWKAQGQLRAPATLCALVMRVMHAWSISPTMQHSCSAPRHFLGRVRSVLCSSHLYVLRPPCSQGRVWVATREAAHKPAKVAAVRGAAKSSGRTPVARHGGFAAGGG